MRPARAEHIHQGWLTQDFRAMRQENRRMRDTNAIYTHADELKMFVSCGNGAVLAYIIDHTNFDLLLFEDTIEEISQACDVSKGIVSSTLKKLNEADLIRKVSKGLWAINPRLACKHRGYMFNNSIESYNGLKR